MQRVVGVAIAAVLVAAAVACGAEEPEHRPQSTAPSSGQTPFPAARDRVPKGYRIELCPDLRQEASGLAIRVAVPDDYGLRAEKEGSGCYFQADLDRDFSVSLDVRQSVSTFMEKEVDPNDGYEGDGGTGDIAYRADVPVYGPRRGELLTWGSNNDGLPLDNRLLQADGVRLAWHVPKGTSARWADELDVVTASIAVLKTRDDTCNADGRTATYSAPEQADGIENYGHYCYIYLRPRDSLLRYAMVDPAPTLTAEELVERRRHQKSVVSVTLDKDAATLQGRPADRLTVVVVRPHRTWDGPAGTWRLVTVANDAVHVTWGATPAQWRREGGVFESFVASVRLVQ